MKQIIFFLVFITNQMLLNAQNVLISNSNNPNEPSIAIDPKHPNVLIAGANIDNYYISTDTGRTWSVNRLSSTYGVWGDPIMAVDTASDLYFFHLSNPPVGQGSWVDRIICQKTTNLGANWTNGSFTGLNGTKVQDKHGISINRKTNAFYLTWTQFDNYGSTNASDSSVILFSKSLNAGATWSVPKRISKRAGDCVDSDNTVEGAVPAVGPNGELYVAWTGPDGIVFNKSLDAGTTWLPQETPVTSMPGGWDFTIPDIYRANGLPFTVCDTTNGQNRGTIYINWSDQRNGMNNTDVWLVKSTDGGATWTQPKRVNDDNSQRQQFFTSMTIDPVSGFLYFTFYDRRNYNDSQTDVFVAVSQDGGNTFTNKKVSQSPFLPNANVFFGDYTFTAAYNGIVRPIWTRLHNGQLSVWTDLTSLNSILVATETTKPLPESAIAFENYPNPTNDYAFACFKLHSLAKVDLAVYDSNGNIIANIINGETRDYGKYVERIDLTSLNIATGVYFLRLKVDGKEKTVRQIYIK